MLLSEKFWININAILLNEDMQFTFCKESIYSCLIL